MPSVIVLEPSDRITLPEGGTVTERLLGQLGQLGSEGIRSVRMGDLAALRAALHDAGDVVLIDGRLLAHAPALRAITGDSRLRSALLVGPAADVEDEHTDPRSHGVRLDPEATTVVSVASPLHRPDGSPVRSVGAIRLGADAVAPVLSHLDDLAASGAPVDSAMETAPVEVFAASAVAAGVRLRPVPIRRMVARRPRAPGAAARVLRLCEDADEDLAWLDAAVKAKDGLFTTFLVSPYSRFVARWAARRGFTPNQVTVASAGVGLIAAAAFAMGTLPFAVIGAIALQMAFTLDCVDGQLSRYTQRFSTFGAWLDSILDRAKELLVYLGVAVGAVRLGDETIWPLAVGAAALLVLRHGIDLAYESARPAPELRAAVVASDPAAQLAAASAQPRPWPRTVAMWGLRFMALPIGERFALISVLAVVSTGRVIFQVLLVWGTFAAVASTGLKLVRARRWPAGYLRWLVPVLPRAIEYGTLTALALVVEEAGPSSFAALAAVALRHYDEGYRGRTLGETAGSEWLARSLAAWPIRVVLLVLAAVLGWAAPALWLVAAIVGALSLFDLLRVWTTGPDPAWRA